MKKIRYEDFEKAHYVVFNINIFYDKADIKYRTSKIT